MVFMCFHVFNCLFDVFGGNRKGILVFTTVFWMVVWSNRKGILVFSVFLMVFGQITRVLWFFQEFS